VGIEKVHKGMVDTIRDFVGFAAEYHFEFLYMVRDCDTRVLLFDTIEKLLVRWEREQD
jgi:hypothetical protein